MALSAWPKVGGGGDVLLDCQVGHERIDFGSAHAVGVTLVVEHAERESLDPIHVGGFGADRIVPSPQGVAHLVEKRLLRRFGGRVGCGHGWLRLPGTGVESDG